MQDSDFKNRLFQWRNYMLANDNLVFDSKDLINQLTAFVPELAQRSLKIQNDILSFNIDWNSVANNTIYYFNSVGGNASPDISKTGSNSGVLITLNSDNLVAQLVFPDNPNSKAMAFRSGMSGLSGIDWVYVPTSAGLMDYLGDNANQLAVVTDIINGDAITKGTAKENTLYWYSDTDGQGLYIRFKSVSSDNTFKILFNDDSVDWYFNDTKHSIPISSGGVSGDILANLLKEYAKTEDVDTAINNALTGYALTTDVNNSIVNALKDYVKTRDLPNTDNLATKDELRDYEKISDYTTDTSQRFADVNTQLQATVKRDTNTGNVAQDTNFTGRLQKGGIDVATAADLKSVENSAWHVMTGSSDFFASFTCLYRINTSEKRIELIAWGETNHAWNGTLIDLSSIISGITSVDGWFSAYTDNLYDSEVDFSGTKLTSETNEIAQKGNGGILSHKKLTEDGMDNNPCYVYYTGLV